ncbi:MATE family efflux transporter DinF [Pseudoalteromonas ruthenica]|nr:MATE family efflux transporter DinF [Pseudoalteromonas ruthenica]TMO52992.1 MATE family efflux transporter DinF [Pseudoalteromonas ruthenica]
MGHFFKHNTHHKSLLMLAGPMILSNITVPLLGLVDTAVIGHLGSAHYLAGIALGATVISMLFWLAGFLRMSTTGLIATAYGEQNKRQLVASLQKSIMLALLVALLLIVCQHPLAWLMAQLSDASAQTIEQANHYFYIRIYSAPAALSNLVLLGWMLGVQYGRGPFLLVLLTNVVNIALDLYFVLGLEMGVKGAALASVMADYCALGFALWLVSRLFKRHQLQWHWYLSPKLLQLGALLRLNGDIFFRSLMLQLCFSFMTFYGARLGDVVLAANAVLMNFLLLISFAMDGIAYAAEAKVGQAKGAKDEQRVRMWVRISMQWGLVFALLYALIFLLGGGQIIRLLTDVPAVNAMAITYLPWLIAMPLIAMGCFLFDGVFVGLMRAKDMRNTMIFSAAVGFFGVFALTQGLGNHALWAAMTAFMGLRGITLALRYHRLAKSHQLLI